jgi:metallo-beta-lactamase family protein
MAFSESPQIIHHGAINGVTGSCHQLQIDSDNSVLIDCGLFQGAETSANGASFEQLTIDFEIETVRALLVTHCHIDHVGRIPYLLAAGFTGPIICTQPTAVLLPLVLQDAVKIGFTRDPRLLKQFIQLLQQKIVAVAYREWYVVPLAGQSSLKVRFNPAGHILGSAYIECVTKTTKVQQTTVFSGDLGGPFTPLLPSPKSPYQADVLVLESTYGDKNHDNRKQRKQQLKGRIIQCLSNKGVILIPAFSIGRTQELLYELEELIYSHRKEKVYRDLSWDDLEIIVDSPLASQFTETYRQLKPFWDNEARQKLQKGRHPLSFEQLTTIDGHKDHLATVAYLQKTARPCIVIAASGMCAGGRIVNYLKGLIEDPRTDVLLVGYQAAGTPGRTLQQYGENHGYVEFDQKRYTINAGIYTLSGYSAHADQDALIRFVTRMRKKPHEIRLVHGDQQAKMTLQYKLQRLLPESKVWIP